MAPPLDEPERHRRQSSSLESGDDHKHRHEDRYRSSRSDRKSRHSPDEDLRKERRRDSRERHRDRHGRRRRSVSREDSDRRDRDRDRERDKDRRSRRREDDRRPERRRHHSRSKSPGRKSLSPPPKRRRHSYSKSKSPPPRRARGPLPSQQDSFRQDGDPSAPAEDPPVEKQKPNFNSTGLLAKEANTVAGTNTVLKYHEPAEARKPPAKEQWRMYVFKQKDMVDTIHLFSRSCWLMGRDQQVVDFQLEHPSISKQHAVIQFRHTTKTNEFGDKKNKVKPYLIDLDSANGTRLNGSRIEPSRYIELRDADVVGFGDSEREYVMMLPPP